MDKKKAMSALAGKKVIDAGEVDLREKDRFGQPLPPQGGTPAADRLVELGYERDEKRFAGGVPAGQDSLSRELGRRALAGKDANRRR